MTNKERREKLRKINDLIFEIEDSYKYSAADPHPTRLQLYRTRIQLGYAEQQIRNAQRDEENETLRD